MISDTLPGRCASLLALILCASPLAGQEEPPPVPAGRVPGPGAYLPGFDALQYEIRVTLPDTGSAIQGEARIDIARIAPLRDTLRLDLSGLRVQRVRAGRPGSELAAMTFQQNDGRLYIALPRATAPDTMRVEVLYQGVPDDGLILRPNVHGTPAAFADNWPDRARFWFPSIDHPSDKATVAFEVRAPAGWSVIANGRRTDATADQIWNYRVQVPIPTYTMVIGATRLSVGTIDACAQGGVTELRPDGCVAVTSWTFPEDSASGARIFRRAGDMIRYYAGRFGAFPYEKLAHVQSATRFGGMENVGAIFYSEQAIASGSLGEVTVAHETAHQWFGDAVTPATWSHLWLSEGFATYFGMQYFEEADGIGRFRELLRESAAGYLQSEDVNIPIVDTLHVPENNLFALLNRNSYNKGGQVLHMLRGLVGDSAFFAAIAQYYGTHRNGTATTRDLQDAFEAVSGRDLGWFFEQWVYRPGYPQLALTTRWDAEAGEAVVRIEQTQSADWPTFRIPLELEFHTSAGAVRHRVDMEGRTVEMRVKLPGPPDNVIVDPDDWLLETVARD